MGQNWNTGWQQRQNLVLWTLFPKNVSSCCHNGKEAIEQERAVKVIKAQPKYRAGLIHEFAKKEAEIARRNSDLLDKKLEVAGSLIATGFLFFVFNLDMPQMAKGVLGALAVIALLCLGGVWGIERKEINRTIKKYESTLPEVRAALRAFNLELPKEKKRSCQKQLTCLKRLLGYTALVIVISGLIFMGVAFFFWDATPFIGIKEP